MPTKSKRGWRKPTSLSLLRRRFFFPAQSLPKWSRSRAFIALRTIIRTTRIITRTILTSRSAIAPKSLLSKGNFQTCSWNTNRRSSFRRQGWTQKAALFRKILRLYQDRGACRVKQIFRPRPVGFPIAHHIGEIVVGETIFRNEIKLHSRFGRKRNKHD